METFIRKVELAEGISDIHLSDGYNKLLALITLHGMPLGEISLSECDRIVPSGQLAGLIAEKFCAKILRSWLQRSIGIRHGGPWQESLPSISVIIPTCDRPDDLRKCLQSLSEAEYERKTIIVVDNGSASDLTYGVTAEFGAKYVREKRQGLDFARNAGITASESDIVAFADDDVVVDRMWLCTMAEVFREDSAIACVTGLTMPLELETEAQELFEGYCDGGMRRGYERHIFHRFNLPSAAAGKVGAGANMALRLNVLKEIGLFDEALDCGTPAKAGGDTDMFYRVLRHGYKICYEPRVLSWHKHRRSMAELQKQLSGYSIAVYAFLTKCLIEYHDMQAVHAGFAWFKSHHVKNIFLSLLGKHPMPRGIVVSEFIGVFHGPFAYFKSRAYAEQVNARFVAKTK